jgi:hypothetical protein
LSILEREAQQQDEAVDSAKNNLRIFNDRYVGGRDSYLQVITAQTTYLDNERNQVDIRRRRMDATVLLVKALGGGWARDELDSYRPETTARQGEPFAVRVYASRGASEDAAGAAAAHDVLVYYFSSQTAVLDADLANSLNAIPDGKSKADGAKSATWSQRSGLHCERETGWRRRLYSPRVMVQGFGSRSRHIPRRLPTPRRLRWACGSASSSLLRS